MKKFFRRLSSKDIKPASSFHHNGYDSPSQATHARSTEIVGAVNPTFTAFQQHETKPQERNVNDNVERDHLESETAVFESQSADTGRRPSSARSPKNSHSKSAAQSRGNDRHPSRRRHAQSMSGSMHNSSDSEIEFSEQLGANYAASEGWQPSTYIYQHDTSNGRKLSKHCSNTSAASLTSGFHHEPSMETAPSLPQTIYRSYDSDILSSGGRAFDNGPILATAPSGDWIWEEGLQKQPSLHRHDSLGRRSSRSRHSYQSTAKPPLPQNPGSPLTSSHSGQINNGVSHTLSLQSNSPLTPRHLGHPNHGMSHTLSLQPGRSPHASRTNEAQGPRDSGQSYATPFARYSQVSKSQSMDSQDLDTAMRGAAQGYWQKPAEQANGSTGIPCRLTALPLNMLLDCCNASGPTAVVLF